MKQAKPQPLAASLTNLWFGAAVRPIATAPYSVGSHREGFGLLTHAQNTPLGRGCGSARGARGWCDRWGGPATAVFERWWRQDLRASAVAFLFSNRKTVYQHLSACGIS